MDGLLHAGRWNLFARLPNLCVTFKRGWSGCGGMPFTSPSCLCLSASIHTLTLWSPRSRVGSPKAGQEGCAFINGLLPWWMLCCLRIRTLEPQRCLRETVTNRQESDFHHSLFLHARRNVCRWGGCTMLLKASVFVSVHSKRRTGSLQRRSFHNSVKIF